MRFCLPLNRVKIVQDKRLLWDILQIEQAIAIDGIITEGSELLGDPLAKKGVDYIISVTAMF